jgi:hypothetical protein
MVNGKCGTQQVSRDLAAELSVELREVLEPLLAVSGEVYEPLRKSHKAMRAVA